MRRFKVLYLITILFVKGTLVKMEIGDEPRSRGGSIPKATERAIKALAWPSHLSVFPPTRINGRRKRILRGQNKGTHLPALIL